jgi:hypothetical protein
MHHPVKSKVLTNKAWKELERKGRGLGLTDEMRGSVEFLIEYLRNLQAQDEDRLIPRELKRRLRALAKKAESLAEGLEHNDVGLATQAAEASRDCSPSSWTADLVGTPRPMRGRQPKNVSQPITFSAFTKYLRQLPERLEQAAMQVQHRPGKTYDADMRRHFLKRLATLLQHKISQSDKWCAFLGALYKIAGCRVGEESIRNDIEEVQKMRHAPANSSSSRPKSHEE